jgi:hypothetical protein
MCQIKAGRHFWVKINKREMPGHTKKHQKVSQPCKHNFVSRHITGGSYGVGGGGGGGGEQEEGGGGGEEG